MGTGSKLEQILAAMDFDGGWDSLGNANSHITLILLFLLWVCELFS